MDKKRLDYDEFVLRTSDISLSVGTLTAVCPVCGREFGCNKAYHVYTALIKRKRQYYCSYSCYKKRPNPKEKR